MNIALWIIQVLLAIEFLFGGATKVFMSTEALMKMSSPNAVHVPIMFLRFIGVCELLGALGLLLPGIFRIKQGLTPLAAAGLMIITIGATVITIMGDGVGLATIPFVTALLCAFVAYGRSRSTANA
jgi:uncharacterized membrane protein YphA (DoxX/SURF4 family)